MKRTWLLAALFLLLGAGAFYAWRQKNQAVAGSYQSWDMEFAVKNPADVTKIFIADRTGQKALLERKDGYWLYNGQYHARPTAIKTLFETLTEVQVQYIPPKAAEEHIIKSLAGEGIKVEIYTGSDKPSKVYYVGGVTSDERGTFMMMDGAERPYVVHIPTFIGQLRVRYLLGDDNWRDRSIFEEKPEEIQSVAVEYPQQRSESFKLEKVKTGEYTVKPFFSTTPASKQQLRKGSAEAYLLQFESKIAEAYETQNPLRDSVAALVPFAVLTVKKTDGAEKQVRFWPVEIEINPDTGQPYVDRYFAECSWGAFMLIQQRVFGPVFQGYSFFFEGNRDAPRMPN